MEQPPVPGPGQGDQPGRDPGMPGGTPHTPGSPDGRDPRLAAFAQHAAMDQARPGVQLAALLDELSGPARTCPGASDDELTGMLGRWAAVESWAAAARLGLTAELVRRRAEPGHEPKAPGGMPSQWHQGTGHEIAAALAISLQSADGVVELAVALQERLPGIGALLADGTIDYLKAKIAVGELAVLDAAAAARAEVLLLPLLAGKTPGQIGRLAADAVLAADPGGAERRREHAQRELARVAFWRERSGTAALAGYALPTDAALAASAHIKARALAYKRAKVSPGASMDQLRVLAFCDILNAITAAARIAQARAEQQQAEGQQAAPPAPGSGTGPAGPGDASAPDNGTGTGTNPGSPSGPDGPGSPSGLDGPGGPGASDTEQGTRDDADPDGPGRDGQHAPQDIPGSTGPDGDHRAGPVTAPPVTAPPVTAPPDTAPPVTANQPDSVNLPDGTDAAGSGPALAAATNLTLPLATLQGLAQCPGHGQGLGPLDPALARDLAAAAARSPHSTWCLTITDTAGTAIAHGCARPIKTTRKHQRRRPPPATGRGARDSPWTLTPRDGPGPGGGYGTWTLTMPGGRHYRLDLHPIPVTSCDHRYEAHAYQPGDLLRHLVQIRDGTCAFPFCSRPARDCDYEHAIPYHQGGRTCACNGSPKSRRCHQVKQSRGWTVTQPQPGWHQWTAPSGRTYVQGPMKYPA